MYPFKVQAAKDLGLWAKVEQEGWGALTSLESGRLGGYMQRLVKEAREEGRIPPSATET
ncbi:MAG: small, acid-soluble spore protein, alpha/beta type [Bacillota bacterium]|nr:MAG: small, acid-soluble spore protein, alpha/beta type [Bacillota bacterium]